MEAVYPIETVYEFCPTSALPDSVAPQHQERLRQYIAARLAEGLFDAPQQPYRFYLLSRDRAMQLPHQPAPSRNPQGHCYFTLEELMRGEPVVSLASQISE